MVYTPMPSKPGLLPCSLWFDLALLATVQESTAVASPTASISAVATRRWQSYLPALRTAGKTAPMRGNMGGPIITTPATLAQFGAVGGCADGGCYADLTARAITLRLFSAIGQTGFEIAYCNVPRSPTPSH